MHGAAVAIHHASRRQCVSARAQPTQGLAFRRTVAQVLQHGIADELLHFHAAAYEYHVARVQAGEAAGICDRQAVASGGALAINRRDGPGVELLPAQQIRHAQHFECVGEGNHRIAVQQQKSEMANRGAGRRGWSHGWRGILWQMPAVASSMRLEP